MEAPRPDTPGTDFRGITDTSGLPEAYRSQEPLWELHQSATTTRRESCTRLYADGSVYTWSSTRRVLDERGLPSRVPAPPAWRLDARISDEALSEIHSLLAAETFNALQSASGGRVSDGGSVVVRARVDGELHTWTFTGAADEELPAPVRAVSLAIQRGVVPGAVPVEN